MDYLRNIAGRSSSEGRSSPKPRRSRTPPPRLSPTNSIFANFSPRRPTRAIFSPNLANLDGHDGWTTPPGARLPEAYHQRSPLPNTDPLPYDKEELEGRLNQHFSQLQKLADRVEFCNEWIQMDGIVLGRLEDEVKRAHERSKPPRERETEKSDQGNGKGKEKEKEKEKEPELESLDGTGEKKEEVNGKEEEENTNGKAQESVNEDKLQSETEMKMEEEPEDEKKEGNGKEHEKESVEEPQSKMEQGKGKEREKDGDEESRSKTEKGKGKELKNDSDEHPQTDGGNDEKPEENKGKGKLVKPLPTPIDVIKANASTTSLDQPRGRTQPPQTYRGVRGVQSIPNIPSPRAVRFASPSAAEHRPSSPPPPPAKRPSSTPPSRTRKPLPTAPLTRVLRQRKSVEELMDTNSNIRDLRERIEYMRRWRNDMERSVFFQREEYRRLLHKLGRKEKKYMSVEENGDGSESVDEAEELKQWGVGGRTWVRGMGRLPTQREWEGMFKSDRIAEWTVPRMDDDNISLA